jgi:hypothetical protein
MSERHLTTNATGWGPRTGDRAALERDRLTSLWFRAAWRLRHDNERRPRFASDGRAPAPKRFGSDDPNSDPF